MENNSRPLADRLRPDKIENVVGQKHIIGKNKVLSVMAETGKFSNLIFYGPSGTGKTTHIRKWLEQPFTPIDFSLNVFLVYIQFFLFVNFFY